MAFSPQLSLQMIPEWTKKYVCYETLLAMLNKDKMDLLRCDCDTLKPHKALTVEFFQACDQELNKVTGFFLEKLAEAHHRVSSFGIVAQEVSNLDGVGFPPLKRISKIKETKMAVSELYLSLAFLQRYQELNYTCFCKITQIYDSKFNSKHGLDWRNEQLDKSLLKKDRGKCEQLMCKLETFMIQLEWGDNVRAMKRLQIPPICKKPRVKPFMMLRIGFCSGIVLVLVIVILIRVLNEPNIELFKHHLQLYKGSFLLIEFLFLVGLNLYCYSRSVINHTLIFGLNPRDHLSHYHLFEMAGELTVCWCTSLLVSLQPPVLSIPQQLHPLLLHSLLLFVLLNPFSTFHAAARRWLMVTMCRVLLAPCHPVTFADCWLADQLNSLSPLFLSLRDLLYFYTCQIDWRDMWSFSSPSAVNADCGQHNVFVTCLVQCFPPWLRFAQCLRSFCDSGNSLHLLNAGKYFTVFLMITFAGLYNTSRGDTYLYIWAVVTCLGVLVTVAWDFRMDWGLLQVNGLLKDELIFPPQLYYAAMIENMLLRISWAVNILLVQMKDSGAASTISVVLAPLEVLRRLIWNVFRLENEHLKNCEKFCAVRDFWNVCEHQDHHHRLTLDSCCCCCLRKLQLKLNV